MTRLQSYFAKACGVLGLRVEIPFQLKFTDGSQISAQVLFPQLGAPRGTIIVTLFAELKGKEKELAEMGFSYSVMGEPLSDVDYEVGDCIETFSEWGWGSTGEKKPDWMKDQEDQDEK
jgi:hypothetical protein